MAEFFIAYNKTLKNEGGYANDPDDRGGETWKGIARKMHPKWKGWYIIDMIRKSPDFPNNLKSNHLLESYVREWYEDNVWHPIHGDDIVSQDMANQLFDSGTNIGVKQAIILAKRQFELEENTVFTDELLNKLNGLS